MCLTGQPVAPGQLCLLAVFYHTEAPPEVRMFSCQIPPQDNTFEAFRKNKHLTLKMFPLAEEGGCSLPSSPRAQITC